ncbi:hypothetical protein [Aeoliella straminimaris]|nr:hypothetical protein [Aeoliella straminimaris]
MIRRCAVVARPALLGGDLQRCKADAPFTPVAGAFGTAGGRK